ncbi:MAG: hypothetical protein KAI79_16435, partial [Bacteroidales bacterium]|nr:hypothetical protein [Bacteroidales bacterium]
MLKFYIFIMVGLWFPQHKFYLSLTEIRYSEQENALQIAVKLFTDDLENAINNEFTKNIKLSNTTNSELQNKAIEEYLQGHFKVKVNGKTGQLHYLGSETELEATWCYIEIENIKKLKQLSVENDIFLELFEEQSNIINFIYNNKTRS